MEVEKISSKFSGFSIKIIFSAFESSAFLEFQFSLLVSKTKFLMCRGPNALSPTTFLIFILQMRKKDGSGSQT